MGDSVLINLEPLGEAIEARPGTSLRDILYAYGVEFPCGGRGHCRSCRVKVAKGSLAITPEQERMLTPDEVAAGWRLACRCAIEGEVTLQVSQWETAILADNSAFEFTPAEGFGVAVDLGTTTLVAQLVDLKSGQVLGVQTALNPQVGYGSDVMTRVEVALTESGAGKLREMIRREIGDMIARLVASTRVGRVSVGSVLIVGNTVMHHLFCGIGVEPLSHVPFEPLTLDLQTFRPGELGWSLEGDPAVRFLPCLGGFVGSDVLAGVYATRIHESDALIGLIDLGTNGEIVLGNRERMLCASTAAGPAFEGGRISNGMRATTGAIYATSIEEGRLMCQVLGDGAARGVCGSGLVDAVATCLDLGRIESSGRPTDGRRAFPLAPGVTLTLRDVRELQLAKAAISAGIRILLAEWGAQASDVERLYLAGAFGNYVRRSSARRIGMIDFPDAKTEPIGNTALLGAKLALFATDQGAVIERIRARTKHISLASNPRFQEIFVDEMAFPEARM